MTLRNPHFGWEGELLAAHLLSPMSFVARPMSVPDDQGSDFFCTLFEVAQPAGAQPRLQPKNSFAIQVKTSNAPSETGTLDMTRSLEYLKQLHLPFFVGHVTLADSALDIFSAELLPLALSFAGDPSVLRFVPTKGFVNPNDFGRQPSGDIPCLCRKN